MKKKIIKADEHFSNDFIDISRFGKNVRLRSGSEDRQIEFMKKIADGLPQLELSICEAVKNAREIIERADPLTLLQRAYWELIVIQTKNGGPSDAPEQIYMTRLLEYSQCMIASLPQNEKTEQCSDRDWETLKSLIENIYSGLTAYLFSKSASKKLTDPKFTPEEEIAIHTAIVNKLMIRGVRYQLHELCFFREFLSPHDEIFKNIWGIGVNDVLSGIRKIIDSLTTGFRDAKEKLYLFHQKYDFDINWETLPEEIKAEIIDSVEVLTGFQLFDLQKITKWPTAFLDDLSWQQGENLSFLSEGEYSGWPLRELPIFQRPFLKIKGKHYCFELLCFLDYFYRVLERTIMSKCPTYREQWNKKQKEISEKLPFDLIKKIIPEADDIRNFYYKLHGKKDWAECDGIIIYDDVLFVVEIKGGNLRFDSSQINVDTYREMVRGLVEKPLKQAENFLSSLEENDSIEICDESHSVIKTIQNKSFRLKIKLGITIESLTNVTADLQRLAGIGLNVMGNCASWGLAIDDLRVYSDIFEDNPLPFLHFIAQRMKAAGDPVQHFSDEIDHLGAYFDYNHYDKKAAQVPEDINCLVWGNFSQAIDEYYAKLLWLPAEANKPQQQYPTYMLQLLKSIRKSKSENKRFIANLLLDDSSHARGILNDCINNLSKSPANGGRISHLDSLSLTQYSSSPQINASARENAILTSLINNDKERVLLFLNFNNGKIENITSEIIRLNELSAEEIKRYSEKAEVLAAFRVAAAKKKGEIGRNDPCPCGSGKKYKKCCLRRGLDNIQ